MGHRIVLFEKEQYPFHKVCGEYISMESWEFLCRLGVDLENLHVSRINKLEISSANGKILRQQLPLGGFGISRYLLDNELAKIARASGVTLIENCKVSDVSFKADFFSVEANGRSYVASVACGTYGKRSNLDIRWQRPFAISKKNKLNNFIGIKYHIKTNFATDSIALHNFKNGYCGIVKIEADKYCLCYLTTAENLRKADGNIKLMEERILSANPYLKKIFESSEILYDTPLSISQISFDEKKQVEDHLLMTGDAAGMITPLCGNGMSMAMHGSKLAAEQVNRFLNAEINRLEMEINYRRNWKRLFARRLWIGRKIQHLFGNNTATNLLLSAGRAFPALTRYLVRQTHGKPF